MSPDRKEQTSAVFIRVFAGLVLICLFLLVFRACEQIRERRAAEAAPAPEEIPVFQMPDIPPPERKPPPEPPIFLPRETSDDVLL